MKLFFHLLATIAALTLFSFQPQPQNPPSEKQQAIQKLETEIDTLEKQLGAIRQEALNHEIQAQPYLFDNWHDFAEDIRLNEKDEHEIHAIKVRLENLYRQRNAIKNPPPSNRFY